MTLAARYGNSAEERYLAQISRFAEAPRHLG
jgi:hypothetical protein